MTWSDIKIEVLIRSARHCCVCHRYAGLKIEVHHIKQRSKGGTDSLQNAIALCFDCHTDAGHYNLDHPRGSKFSPSELVLARDRWYEIVSQNKISIPIRISEHIHCRHLVLQSIGVAKDIFKGKLDNLPVNKPLLVNNHISDSAKKLFNGSKNGYAYLINHRDFQDLNAVINAYPNLKRVDKSGFDYPYFTFERTPSRDELLAIENELDPVAHLLLEMEVPIHLFAKSLIQESDICSMSEDGSYEELFVFRSVWFSYLAMENTSHYPLILSELMSVGKKIERNYMPFYETTDEIEMTVALPNAPMKPGETVLIPTAIVACPFTDWRDDYEIARKDVGDDNDYSYYMLNHSFNENADNNDYMLLGSYMRPKELQYSLMGQKYNCDIHEMDPNNLYTIDQYWDCGSCPHLFFQYDDERWHYVKELFAKNTGLDQNETFIINKGVKRVRIVELENEITFIKNVSVNNEKILANVKMINGDSFEFSVTEGDHVFLLGHYEKIFENVPIQQQSVFRNHVISRYLKANNTRI